MAKDDVKADQQDLWLVHGHLEGKRPTLRIISWEGTAPLERALKLCFLEIGDTASRISHIVSLAIQIGGFLGVRLYLEKSRLPCLEGQGCPVIRWSR